MHQQRILSMLNRFILNNDKIENGIISGDLLETLKNYNWVHPKVTDYIFS